jgi:hypothetical protein
VDSLNNHTLVNLRPEPIPYVTKREVAIHARYPKGHCQVGKTFRFRAQIPYHIDIVAINYMVVG